MQHPVKHGVDTLLLVTYSKDRMLADPPYALAGYTPALRKPQRRLSYNSGGAENAV